MEKRNLLDAEFKTQVIKVLSELSENFNSINEDKSEIKITLTEIKIIYRELKVELMKPRIKSVIVNIKKQKTPNQDSKKKKESKRIRIEYGGTTSIYQHSHHRSAGRRERARN